MINLAGASGAGNNAVLNLGTVTLTNEAGGTITGGGIIQNTSPVINFGNIFATNTAVELQFTNAATFGNAGTLGAATGATLTFGAAGVGSAIITNSGTVALAGGTLRSGTITNLGAGLISGAGQFLACRQPGTRQSRRHHRQLFRPDGPGTTVTGSGTVAGTATVSGGLLRPERRTYSNAQMIVNGTGRRR